MNNQNQQTISAGQIAYDENRKKNLERYKKAVGRAGFLGKRDKENWILLAHMLTSEQLKEGGMLIINEDLRRLKMREQLEKIKPLKESKND